ncbi:hypothetical protein TacPo2_49 [Pantoea bacteriophage TacPo2]
MELAPKKAKLWKEKDLKGLWTFYRKIDGVRAIRNLNPDIPAKYVSRNAKPLHNLDHLEFDDAEIFKDNWETSVSMVRTHCAAPVDACCVYSLADGKTDSRLLLFTVQDPSVEFIKFHLEQALEKGDEGLILREAESENPKWLKVKNKETHDVVVTGFQAGTGKHDGRMGALLTTRGKVGTGFTDAERDYWQERWDEGTVVGITIEVECMELTPAGQFRHPRFVRERIDKDA